MTVDTGSTRDCAVRRLAYDYALQLQPARAPLRDVWDALQITQLCGDRAPFGPLGPGLFVSPKSCSMCDLVNAVFVDARRGQDRNPGTEAEPVATLAQALVLIRSTTNHGKSSSWSTILLRQGVHVINQTLLLTADDSGLVISNFPGEEVRHPICIYWLPVSDSLWEVASLCLHHRLNLCKD